MAELLDDRAIVTRGRYDRILRRGVGMTGVSFATRGRWGLVLGRNFGASITVSDIAETVIAVSDALAVP